MAGHEHAKEGHGGDNRIALLISVLALFLAMVETGGKGAQTDVITHNVEAANLWAFFQARTVRQTMVRTAAEQVELQKVVTPDVTGRTAIEVQQQVWQDRAAAWESEPATGEGRKELAGRARQAEAQRQRSLAKAVPNSVEPVEHAASGRRIVTCTAEDTHAATNRQSYGTVPGKPAMFAAG